MKPTRRQVLEMLGALGMTGPVMTARAQQGAPEIGADDLRGALAIQGRSLADSDIEALRRALQLALNRFQPVRELELDDAIAPAVMFVPGKRSDG